MSHAALPTPVDSPALAAPDVARTSDKVGLEQQVDAMLSQAAHTAALIEEDAPVTDEPVATVTESEAEALRRSVNEEIEGLSDAAAATNVTELDEALSATASARLDEAEPGEGASGSVADDPAPADASEAATLEVERSDALDAAGLAEGAEAGPGESPQTMIVESQPEPVGETAIASGTSRLPLVRGAAHLVGELFALPMKPLSHAARDLLGWFALVTVFNALCVWLYILLK